MWIKAECVLLSLMHLGLQLSSGCVHERCWRQAAGQQPLTVWNLCHSICLWLQKQLFKVSVQACCCLAQEQESKDFFLVDYLHYYTFIFLFLFFLVVFSPLETSGLWNLMVHSFLLKHIFRVSQRQTKAMEIVNFECMEQSPRAN